jgi:hypothetical protein
MLEPQPFQSAPHLAEVPWLVEEHEVNDALAAASRNGRAADMLHGYIREPCGDQPSNPCGDLGGSRIVRAKRGR